LTRKHFSRLPPSGTEIQLAVFTAHFFSHSALPESIRRLPWGCSIRVDDGWPRERKSAQQLQEPRRKHPRLLTPTSKTPLPYLLDLLEEALHGPVAPGQAIVGIVTAQNCGKPVPLVSDRYVHPPSHLKAHPFELADHPLSLCLPPDDEAPIQGWLLLGSGVVRPGPGSWAASIWCASKSGSS